MTSKPMNTIKLMLLLSFLSPLSNAALRPELTRFSYLSDQTKLIRNLKRVRSRNFLAADIDISSGLKKMIGDLKEGTSDTVSSTQKLTNAFGVLTKYANSERYMDIGLSASMPLPDITIKGITFFPALIAEMDLGASITIYNQDDPINPKAQVYARKDLKYGLGSIIQTSKEVVWEFAAYQLLRADTLAQASAITLATDGEFYDFGSLIEDQKSIALDVKRIKKTDQYTTLIEVKELLLTKMNSTETLMGSPVYLHARQTWHKKWPTGRISPMVGAHYRKRHDIFDGIYIGLIWDQIKNYPVKFMAVVNAQTFTLMPQLNLSWLKFSYTYRNPYRNPIDKIWVSATHSISLSIPFP